MKAHFPFPIMADTATTTPAYTAGPWIVRFDGDNPHYFITTPEPLGHTIVCIMPTINGRIVAEQKANSDLIAAAPELLSTLKELVESLNALGRFTEDERLHSAFDDASLVIDKAEGR